MSRTSTWLQRILRRTWLAWVIVGKELTHLVIPILALSPRAHERVEPWLDTIADDSV
jgi:hypothetical protein